MKMGSRFVRALLLGAAGALFAGSLPASAASAPIKWSDVHARPQFTTVSTAPAGLRTTRTVPYWSSSFTDPTNGQTYAYTMVGGNPSSGTSTTVPTEIIPLNINFSGYGISLDGTSQVTPTVESPIFQTADIGAAADAPGSASAPPFAARSETEPSDVTQFGDAYARSQWGVAGSSYHVLLGQPRVLATQTLTVPQRLAFVACCSQTNGLIGLVDAQWFSAQIDSLMNSMQIDPHTLPIFLTYNTFLYVHSLSNCCILGYHGESSPVIKKIGAGNGNGNQPVQTFIFTAYSDPGIFAPNQGDSISYIQDVQALSHEVAEWIDDPFTDNKVNPWLTPTAPQYGCTSLLEVGDPVVGFGFLITMPNGITYHPEDAVFYSWFARESPSRSSAGPGVYTYLNNFPDVASGC